MFQCPLLPEALIAAEDYKFLENLFRSKRSGLKNQGNISDADIEAWKYVFSRPGRNVEARLQESAKLNISS